MKLRKYSTVLAALLVLQAAVFAATNNVEDSDSKSVERFAVYVGSNRGGEGRETLRYAGSDAQKIASTMLEVGGIKHSNSHILVDPNRNDIERIFDIVSSDLKNVSDSAKRTEFLFYYSGHSDENALLLGDERYSYSELKAAISKIPSEVHVVMLDSCFSGNFIRAKGGQRQKSFLVDDSSVVQGHAYLSSSSASESSQESDAIGSSFFTNSLVTGLRGAADTSGDNKVSLNELYYYAFNDTLYNTEDSAVGPQHPSFNITLVGSGDLVLTDISEAEAILVLPEENDGRFLIRNQSGALVSEVAKTSGTQIVLALPSGRYSVTAITAKTTLQSEVTLLRNYPVTLKQGKMALVERKSTAVRGNSIAQNDEDTDDSKKENGVDVAINGKHYDLIHASVIPSMQFPDKENIDSIVSVVAVAGTDRNVLGLQLSLLVSRVEQDLAGVQYTGIAGDIRGTGRGLQEAGLFAKSGDFYGIQAAGMGCVSEDLTGVQAAGLFTTAKSVEGFDAAGIFTWADDVHGCQASGIFNKADNFNGMAFAGCFNWADNASVLQASGLMNRAENFNGLQLAGCFNWADNASAIQVSGLMNKADDFNGFQTAGVLNNARKVNGVQVACVNTAQKVNGVQVGVVNYAKEYNGVPIGLINIIPGGILEFGTYIDSDKNMCLQYQGGTKRLFTTLLVGTDLSCSGDYGFWGLGLGTRIALPRNGGLDIEALYKQIFADNRDYSESDILPSIRLTLNTSEHKHMRFFVSCNADLRVEDWNDDVFDDWTHHGKFTYWTIDGRDVNLYASCQAGLKFCL